ncbi:vanadium-dependent haloperoxidase [Streptomyces sp. NPDC050315]|uniref:vanadium-dependent haloperoxidase n=1 Tax=Streptomyces sp. NPDC050315 TaxID=3155039 RepID=UPI003432BD03
MKFLRPRPTPLRQWAVFGTLTAMTLATAVTGPASAASHDTPATPVAARTATDGGNVVLQWNARTVAAMKANAKATGHNTPPPVGGRTLGIVHNAIYDAWAAYDHHAVGTQLGGDLRRPQAERTYANKREAISFAAHRALSDLFPAQRATFDEKLRSLGYDPAEVEGAAGDSPAGIAVTATDALLKVRHEDGSNQLGTPPYAPPPGSYTPVNAPQDVNDFDKDKLVAPDRWAPLTTADGKTQSFITPQFADAEPFLIDDTATYLPPAPPKYGTPEADAAIEKQIERNAHLTERQKAIAEHWQWPGESSSAIPQVWARHVSERDRHSLDRDVKMFFALNIAEADEAVVDWNTKRHYDYGRPITMIRYAKSGQDIKGWAGPGKGTRTIDGSTWRPYLNTPSFAAYGSGHTGFTSAGAEMLKLFTGSDEYGGKGVIKAGSSTIEPGMPTNDVQLEWPTFSAAAEEVGHSRLWGGVHWEFDHTEADAQGRKLARDVWSEAKQYFDGTHPDA